MFSTHTFWKTHLQVLCALLLSMSTYAIEPPVQPPPQPQPQPQAEKKERGLRGFFNRVFNDDERDGSERARNAGKPRLEQEKQAGQSSGTAPPAGTSQAGGIAPVPPAGGATVKSNQPSSAGTAKSRTAKKGVKSKSSESRTSSNTTEPNATASPDAPSPQPELSSTPATATTPPEKENVEFGRPVLGKPGFVYPPGVEQSPQTIVDVGGFQPGQLVRDPRTGKMFRVP